MKNNNRHKRYIMLLVFCWTAALYLNGCGKESAQSSVPTSSVSQKIVSNTANAGKTEEPSKDETIAESNKETGEEEVEQDMDQDEIFALLKERLGIDFSVYADGADGVRNGTRHYIDLSVLEGAEEGIAQSIMDLCGKGWDANSRKRPILNNRLATEFDKAELITGYSYMRQGENGAKTVSTTIYIAKIDGREHVFILGGL